MQRDVNPNANQPMSSGDITSKRVIDWINLILGIWLVVSPWVIPANPRSAWVVVILGILVIIASIWALGQPRTKAAEGWNIAFGVILFFVPWIFNYYYVHPIAWNSWIVGVIIAVLAWITIPLVNRFRGAGPGPRMQT